MGVPVFGRGNNAALYNNTNNQAPAGAWLQNTYGSVGAVGGKSSPESSGTQNANGIGGNAGMYAQAAQMGFSAVYGAIVKPKAANLQAAQIEGNAKMSLAAANFNAAQQKQYANDLMSAALGGYLLKIDMAKEFIGGQKAQMSASGIWGGSTFDAFIDDSVNKAFADIDIRSKETSKASRRIRLQADMMALQAQTQYKLDMSTAKGVRDAGAVSGIMSMFGVG